jgi:hypothetical protein
MTRLLRDIPLYTSARSMQYKIEAGPFLCKIAVKK